MSATTPRRGGLRPLQRAAVFVLPAVVRALHATWRVEVVNAASWRARRAAGGRSVFAMWHGQMLVGVLQHRGERMALLASEHRDGELIARVLGRLGFATIRGSSTRGAARALLAMTDALTRGSDVGVTPDGPRGPAERFQGGALAAAARAGAALVPTGVVASAAWRLRSWDRFMIPKPFARVVVAYGDPWSLEGLGTREAAALTDEATRAMRAAERVARQVLDTPRGRSRP